MIRFATLQSHLFAAVAALAFSAMLVGASVLPAESAPYATILA